MSNKNKDYAFTAYPNFIIKEVMPHIDGNTFKVLSLIVRKTLGHHKKYDRIALSQFEEKTGLSRNTVLKALKYLSEHQIIEKFDRGRINQYRVIMPKDSSHKEQKSSSPKDSTSSGSEPSGSIIEPASVHNLNTSSVQTLNTQKKPIKENEINTTTKEGELERVINTWNAKFDISVNRNDKDLMECILSAINEFSEEQLSQAMDGRLESSYYRKHKPELLHQPKAFFKFTDTIKNDLHRQSNQLLTHKEYASMITEKGYSGDDFEMIDVITDKGTEKRWKLMKQAPGV
ncbi:replication protein [Gracilimonas halophila]|uniref:Replication protein n=2 Tax=Gracilimonas halophila TaxID=1834464 RepID=A0ABW5JJA6_9BACT